MRTSGFLLSSASLRSSCSVNQSQRVVSQPAGLYTVEVTPLIAVNESYCIIFTSLAKETCGSTEVSHVTFQKDLPQQKCDDEYQYRQYYLGIAAYIDILH